MTFPPVGHDTAGEDITGAPNWRRAGMLSTLLTRNFGLLWLGGLFSNLGSWSMFVAIPVFVFQRTGSALAAASVFTATVVPMLLSSVAGVLADRWDRRRLVIVANLIMAALTAPLAFAQTGGLWIVYVCMFSLALTGLVVPPAENALLPTLAGRDRLTQANALNALNDNLARIAGPAVGAAGLTLGGFVAVVIFNVATFLAAAVLVALIRPRHAATVKEVQVGSTGQAAHQQFWAQWRDGVRAARRSPVVSSVLLAATVVVVGDAAFSSLLGPFFAGTLASDGATLGIFLALRGVGGVLGAWPAGHAQRWLRSEQVLAVCLVAIAVLLFVLATIAIVPVAMVCAVLLGIFVVGWISSQQTLIQTNVPDSHLGRVFGVFGTLTALGMIAGSVAAGTLSDHVGTPTMIYVAAGCYTAGALVVATFVRKSVKQAIGVR